MPTPMLANMNGSLDVHAHVHVSVNMHASMDMIVSVKVNIHSVIDSIYISWSAWSQ